MEKIETTTCPAFAAQKVLSGKWKIIIIYHLSTGTKRFNEIHRTLTGITQASLTKQLREMEVDQIIQRKVYPVVPPKVEYSLTVVGKKFLPVLAALCTWGKAYVAVKKT